MRDFSGEQVNHNQRTKECVGLIRLEAVMLVEIPRWRRPSLTFVTSQVHQRSSRAERAF